MERSPLFWQVYERLVADARLPADVARLVEASFDGADAVERALSAGPTAGRPPSGDRRRAAPARTSLTSLSVEGFRGIGGPVTLDLPPGAGLTLIVGRNGSGKSSLAEALEVALTGDTRRARERRTQRTGWRNLHHATTSVEASFVTEGSPGFTVVRTWKPDATELSDACVEVVRGRERVPWASLGWEDALETYRPMLSYPELGRLLDEGPSRLYDELKALLGLEELAAVKAHLSAARKVRETACKARDEQRPDVVRALGGVDDPRARACLAAIEASDLDALRAAAREGQVDPASSTLVALAGLQGPGDAGAVIGALRAAVADADTTMDAASRQSRAAADLLAAALGWHDVHGDGPCPVCQGRALDADWRSRAAAEARALQAAIADSDRARDALDRATKAALALVRPRPPALARAEALGFGSAASEAWDALAAAPRDPRALADHLERTAPVLDAILAALRDAAGARIAASEGRWAAVAQRVRAWAEVAAAAQAGEASVRPLRKAEEWLAAADAALTAERFAPIEAEQQEVWSMLRQESHVGVAGVALAGAANRRRVELDVRVEGQPGAGLGVLSQGEVNALALSLFIPRLSHADSPFRFLVLDDPVQALDAYKVDGLARVLERTARSRQVIVLTHDDRLSEAVRRLQIEATVLEVVRSARSTIAVRRSLSPVQRPIEDAFALSKSKVGPDVMRRVVPALCRSAIEAQLRAVVRRRRLARGDAHAAVEQDLREAETTMELAALALFDDAGRGADVYRRVRDLGGDPETIKDVKEGAHGAFQGDFHALIQRSFQLAMTFEKLR